MRLLPSTIRDFRLSHAPFVLVAPCRADGERNWWAARSCLLVLCAVVAGCGQQSQPSGDRSQSQAVSQAAKPLNELTLADLTKIAQRGDTEAQWQLAVRHENGQKTATNLVEATKWYRKAAEAGHAEGQYSFGFLHFAGKGVPENAGEAFKWFTKAADQGSAKAQFALGAMYRDGEGIAQDQVKAHEFFQKAANQGLAPAQNALGDMYVNGQGVSTNLAEAFAWLVLAAQGGSQEAGKNLDLLVGFLEVGDYVDGQALLEKRRDAIREQIAKQSTLRALSKSSGELDVTRAAEA